VLLVIFLVQVLHVLCAALANLTPPTLASPVLLANMALALQKTVRMCALDAQKGIGKTLPAKQFVKLALPESLFPEQVRHHVQRAQLADTTQPLDDRFVLTALLENLFQLVPRRLVVRIVLLVIFQV
jgi:hypothetical protein